jgi:hypothetical protein
VSGYLAGFTKSLIGVYEGIPINQAYMT